MSLKVYIGFDERTPRAAEVCAKSLRHVTGGQIEPEFLCSAKLRAQGLLTRVHDERGAQDYDLVSNEFTSTRFNISRFLVPILCQQGYALFVDSDTVFLRDPREMTYGVEAHRAISVVKHLHDDPGQWKMVNQRQKNYSRKNWSSVMLFNCDHPANWRLSLRDVNERSRRDLHQFYWLADEEIGALCADWNWLVNVAPKPANVGIAHFTRGGPFIDGWRGAEHDVIWLRAEAL